MLAPQHIHRAGNLFSGPTIRAIVFHVDRRSGTIIFTHGVHGGRVAHVPYAELVNTDGAPKAAKEIWSILVKAGLPRYAEIICVADVPGDAAANYFLLKLMGYPDVKVLMA